ncbi:vWA domain-containing protein [Nakamurella deserti]|uniref:vWA domain-containing protein n=1 Tax=Nakamurella deserti TaxID=2164074 RepID=UPI000DBE5C93|nr:VWA domain-containing protein [Nakamurella deserti]
MNHLSPRPSARRLFAAAAALGLLAAGAVQTGAAAAVAPVESTAPVMIVLDASGSMRADDAPGVRMDAAKAAVTSLIDTLPAGSEVGLMVYGTGTGSADTDKAAGCRDITTLTPVGPLDAATMTAQVASVQASGYTPIGESLRAAAAALPAEGPRSIVLVSDGEDTCAPPTPCDVAAELDTQGVDLTVHTVGFKVDDAARQQLSCIAGATGGTFADAADAAQLEQALKVRVGYALSGYTTEGTPVTGDDQPTLDAPLLTPGQYVDRYALGEVKAGDAGPGRNGTTKYYTVPVQAGFRPYISASLIVPDDVSRADMGIELLGVELSLMTADGTVCADERDSVVNSADRLQPATTVLNGPTVGGPNYRSRCNTDGVQILRVDRIGNLLTDRELAMEIVVRSEPPADASGVPAAAADESEPLPLVNHGSPTPITGGHSFNDAADLISGATYADTLTTGESRYYKFPVQWGQRFAYTLTPTATADAQSYSIAWVDVFNPVRQEVDTEGTDSGQVWFNSLPGDPFSASSSYPARYTNRDSTFARAYALDGSYYLRIDAGLDEDRVTVPFLITVQVSGDVEPGPVYQPDGGGAATSDRSTGATGPSTPSSSSPSTSSPATSPSSSSSSSNDGTATSGSDTSAGTDVADASSAGTTAAITVARATTDTTGPGAAVWIVLASVAAAGLVGLAVGWARRGRSTPPPSHW